jgi:adenosylcobinamide-GDP ribazoletransferase
MRALACAILFLTRIPLPRLRLEARDFARSAGWFAWVGALVALPVWGASLLAPYLGARLAAALALAAWVAITGGLHLDGLADTVDGLSGGRGERARTLEIMRDSRIGAHGALALALLLMLKWAALERIFTQSTRPLWLLAPLAARYAATALIALFPYARSAGLGGPFVGLVRGPALGLGAVPLVCSAAWLGPWAMLPVAVALGVAFVLAWRAHKLLGGLTGDVYGAAIELAELGALLSLTGPGAGT